MFPPRSRTNARGTTAAPAAAAVRRRPPRFAAQGKARRPDHFSCSRDCALRRRPLAGEPSPFLADRRMAEPAQIDVAHVAKLARLNLTEEETKLFQAQLGRVLEYAEKLREPDTSKVEAAAHAVPIFNF